MGKEIGSLFVRLQAVTDDFLKGMNGAERTLARVGRKWSAMGQQMSIGLSLPIIAFAKKSIEAASEFESAMNSISSRGEIVGADLDMLQKQALALGKATQFSAKEVAEGMAEMAAGGFDATQVFKAMPGILDLAAAGTISIKEAAAAAVTTMGQFGLETTDTARIADVLTKAANSGALSVTDLVNSLKYAGPNAKAAGMTLEQTAAAITLLSNAGIKADMAGTAFRMGVLRMIVPTKKGAAALQDLGVKTTDAAGQMLPLENIMDQLSKKNANLAQISKVVGVEASSAFVALKSMGGEALQSMVKNLNDADGAAKRAAATLMKGLPGAIERFNGSVETMFAASGMSMEDAFVRVIDFAGKLIDKITELAAWFKTLSPDVQNFVLGFAAAAAAAGPLLIVLGPLASVLSILTGAFTTLFGAIGLMLTPFGAFLVAAAALGVLGYAIYENWEPLKAFFADLGDEMMKMATGTTWSQFWSEFDAGAATIRQNLTDMKTAVVDFVTVSIEWVQKLGNGIQEWLVNKFTAVADSVKSVTDKVGGYFFNLYDKVVGHSYIPDMVKKIKQHIDMLEGEHMVKPAQRATEKTGHAFEDLQKKIVELMKAGDDKGLEKLADSFIKNEKSAKVFEKAVSGAKDQLADFTEEAKKAKDEAEKLASSLSDTLSEGFSKLGAGSETSKGLGDFFSSILSGTETGGAGGSAASWLSDFLMGAEKGKGLGDLKSKIMEVTGATEGGMAAFGNYASAAMMAFDSIKKIGKNAKSSVEGVTETAGTAIGAYFGSPEAGQAAGKVLGKFLGGFFGNKDAQTVARKKVESFIEEALAKANFKMIGADGKMKELTNVIFGKGMKDGWAEKFNAMGDQAKSTFGGIGQALVQLLGITEDIGPQIGAILAENLLGNVDNARLFVQALGVSQEDMLKALETAAIKGEMSWHDYNVAVAGVNQAYGEGRVAIGDYTGAFKDLIASGGKGMAAVKNFRDIAVEAMESGVTTFAELRDRLLKEGMDPGEVDALFAAAAQRGITTMEQWAHASDATAGSIVGDMYALDQSLAAKWDAMKDTLNDIYETINQIPDKVEKSVEINVSVNDPDGGIAMANSQSSPTPAVQEHANGAVVQSARSFRGMDGMHRFAEAGPEAIMPLTRKNGKLGVDASGMDKGGKNFTVVVNAPNGEAGVEDRIQAAIYNMKDYIVNEAVEATIDNVRRGGRF